MRLERVRRDEEDLPMRRWLVWGWGIAVGLVPPPAGAVTLVERSGDIFEARPCTSVWQGGPSSLPYGTGDANAVLQHARGMSCVRAGIDMMGRHGFARREDLDAAWTRPGYSIAIVAFESPGSDPTTPGAVQPFLVVASKPVRIDGTCWAATQVFGGQAQDSLGRVVPVQSVAESLLVVVDGGGMTGDHGVFRSDEDFSYRYTTFEGGGSSDWREHTSPGMVYLWNEWETTAWRGAEQGAVGGIISSATAPSADFATAAIRVSVGFVTGAVFASQNFWSTPPDTSAVGR
jgi:hypothetical protein